MIVETFWEGSGRDMVNIVIKFLIIVDMWTIVFIVWLILISISDWEWWEIILTNWIIVEMIDISLIVY